MHYLVFVRDVGKLEIFLKFINIFWQLFARLSRRQRRIIQIASAEGV